MNTQQYDKNANKLATIMEKVAFIPNIENSLMN